MNDDPREKAVLSSVTEATEALEGMKILTTKTMSELVEENMNLSMENSALVGTLTEIHELIEKVDDISSLREKLSGVRFEI